MSAILDKIESPLDLARLDLTELEQLAAEIRRLIIDTVSKNGGHLASSLGAVELTLALYSVFRLPTDQVVWDVGHQAYAHKILTGRRDNFATLRKKGGISGFLRRSESPYDAFGAGHASTSISAALGLAAARDLNGRGGHVIAVIGDGSLTGGEAFEGLNHAGHLKKNFIVVLNDNGMSIDGNVGAMSEYLSRLRITPEYNRAKRDLEGLIKSIPHIGGTVLKTANIIKDGVKSAILPGGAFEALGFRYIGPIDGHNLKLLTDVFREVKQLDGPILVHVRTKKGYGYAPAELEPEKFHGIGPFDRATGAVAKKAAAPTYTAVFSEKLLELAREDNRIVAITAAMPSGTGLKKFGEEFPARYFDVGIAEEHAVTLAAGLAAGGLHPVVAIYSTFLQRAYDQIFHDVCLQNLPVVFCLDRAGLVGEDGATHHGVFDLSYLRHIPNMTVMAPADENELRAMLAAALRYKSPVAIRYPRGAALGVERPAEEEIIELGRAVELAAPDFIEPKVDTAGENLPTSSDTPQLAPLVDPLKRGLEEGENLQPSDNSPQLASLVDPLERGLEKNEAAPVAIFAVGSLVDNARRAAKILIAEGIETRVVNMRFIKPLDTAKIIAIAKNPATRLIVTAEENALAGGFGAAVLETLADNGLLKPVLRFGIGDEFIPFGSQNEEREYAGLLPEQIAAKIKNHPQIQAYMT